MDRPLSDLQRRYLDLLEGCLTRELFLDEELADVTPRQVFGHLRRPSLWKQMRAWRLVRPRSTDPARRRVGKDCPPTAETMVGHERLANIRHCVVSALADEVPGDLIEAGVWRGGATIYMRGLLDALGDTTRTVWACDSFEGLPTPAAVQSPVDESETFRTGTGLGVSLDNVRDNFERYDLLDDRVQFVPGWFSDTMPSLAEQIDRIALLRLDGDLYESVKVVLDHLEPLVSPGGFVIVDDYFVWNGCRRAVDDYRRDRGITAPMVEVDWCAAYWRKPLD